MIRLQGNPGEGSKEEMQRVLGPRSCYSNNNSVGWTMENKFDAANLVKCQSLSIESSYYKSKFLSLNNLKICMSTNIN